jgi:alcohol dehydrogenase class IV
LEADRNCLETHIFYLKAIMETKAMRNDWSYPTTIWFGPGRIDELAKACFSLKIKRPLLVLDPNLLKNSAVLNAIQSCRADGIDIISFSQFAPDPDTGNLDSGLLAYRSQRRDGVIGVGGGSAIDLAKAIAFMSGQRRPIWDFESFPDYWKRAQEEGIAPIISIPTTAGTGAEVGRAAVIVDKETQRKRLIFHPRMLSSLVICDPELTVSVPAHITAAVGMDAFSHAFEAFCANAYHPMADGIAIEAMRNIVHWLPVAYDDGANLEARLHLAAAATMGAVAFHKGLGAIHALSHTIGGAYRTHHGLTNAVLLPYVVEFNRPAIQQKIKHLAAHLELPAATFSSFVEWTLAFRRRIGIPHTLRELEIDQEGLIALHEQAALDPTARTNPLKLTPEDCANILHNAWHGILNSDGK